MNAELKMAKIVPFVIFVTFLNLIEAQNFAFCPVPNGRVVNPNTRTCRTFIRCRNGVGTVQQCRRGTRFNGRQCVPGNQAACNRILATQNFNNPAVFGGGFGAGNINPWSQGALAQPGVWGSGVQPLPNAWANGNVQNRWGAGNQGFPANAWNDPRGVQWNNNNGAFAGAGQAGGLNPGLLGAWVNRNWDLNNSDDYDDDDDDGDGQNDQFLLNANRNPQVPQRRQTGTGNRARNNNQTAQGRRRNNP